jgi:Putative Ig domain
VIGAGVTLTLTNSATDPDSWQTLTYSLATAPGGATIASNTGVFSWRPTIAQANTTNAVTLRVADNGSPSLSASNSFLILVTPISAPRVSSATAMNGQFTLQVAGDVGPDYFIESSTNLVHWSTVFATNAPGLPFIWADPDYGQTPLRFYRIRLGP